MSKYCTDCPDREWCGQGGLCSTARGVEAIRQLNNNDFIQQQLDLEELARLTYEERQIVDLYARQLHYDTHHGPRAQGLYACCIWPVRPTEVRWLPPVTPKEDPMHDPMNPKHERLRDQLRDWWLDKANLEVSSVVPKAIEYGSTDLAEIGHTMGRMIGRFNMNEEEATDVGIFFYVTGKLARWEAAIKDGRRVSADTLLDIGIYTRMAQRNQDVGGWPFNHEEDKA